MHVQNNTALKCVKDTQIGEVVLKCG